MALTKNEEHRLRQLAQQALSGRPATREEYERWIAEGWTGALTEEEIGAFYDSQMPPELRKSAESWRKILDSFGGEN